MLKSNKWFKKIANIAKIVVVKSLPSKEIIIFILSPVSYGLKIVASTYNILVGMMRTQQIRKRREGREGTCLKGRKLQIIGNKRFGNKNLLVLYKNFTLIFLIICLF